MKIYESAENYLETIYMLSKQQSEVHSILFPEPSDAVRFFLLKKSLLHQQIQIDQIMVARKAGTGLIGRVSESGGIQRQDLPVTLLRLFQKVHKFKSMLSHGADAVRTGQRCDMH